MPPPLAVDREKGCCGEPTDAETDAIKVSGPQDDSHMARIAQQIAFFTGRDTDVRWINIIDRESNPDGKFGCFRMTRRTAE